MNGTIRMGVVALVGFLFSVAAFGMSIYAVRTAKTPVPVMVQEVPVVVEVEVTPTPTVVKQATESAVKKVVTPKVAPVTVTPVAE